MKVIRNIREIEYDKKTAVSVGTFDGVHSGVNFVTFSMVPSGRFAYGWPA